MSECTFKTAETWGDPQTQYRENPVEMKMEKLLWFMKRIKVWTLTFFKKNVYSVIALQK